MGKNTVVSPYTKLALAPLASLSHGALRTLIHQYGDCDLYFSEMTSADALSSGGHYERFYLMADPEPNSFILQLVSGKKDALVTAIRDLADTPLLGFDINMGCSAPHIVRKGGGYAWMSTPDAAAALVSGAKSAAKTKSLSVKIRIGDTPDPVFFTRFIRKIEDAGADFITIHTKTAKQSFNRPGFPDFVGLAVAELNIPVFGNGDIRSYHDFKRMEEQQRPSGIMIGREAVKSPWIFHAIRLREMGDTLDQEIDLLTCAETFVQLLPTYQPVDFLLSRAKLFFSYFGKNFKFSHDLIKRINRCANICDMVDEISAYVERNPSERSIRI